ncbi:MAG: ATP-binding protein [Rickettsiales bacterium]|nr:MAG: ATP-binding protein [Rickettsiales bacterium]
MFSIKPREKIAIIESLKAGIVPKIGLKHIQVGRALEVNEIIKDLEKVADGSAKSRFIIGDYGSGKTFFLTLSKLIAHEKDFVVINADITEDKILSASNGRAQNLFSELINNMSVKSKTDGGALAVVIEKWLTNFMNEGDTMELSKIISLLSPLENYTSSYDFCSILGQYMQAYLAGEDLKMSNCLRWLRAEYKTKTDARNDLGVRTIIDDNNFYDYLKLFAKFIQMAGYKGLLVNIDELAVISRLQKPLRDKNFERILTIINDSLQGSAENIEFIFGGTIEFLEDGYKGMYSYGALQSRLADNQFSTKDCKDLTGLVIRLDNLTQEELFMLLYNIRNVFAEYKEEKYLLKDSDIETYMKYILSKLGAKSFLSPRESVKSFAGLLTQLENNPDKNIEYFLGKTIDVKEDTTFDGFDLSKL